MRFTFYFQGCPHAWVNAHKRLSCGRKWAWPRVKFVNVCVCAVSSKQTSSETRRAEIRESRLTCNAGQHLNVSCGSHLVARQHQTIIITQCRNCLVCVCTLVCHTDSPPPTSTRWCAYLSYPRLFHTIPNSSDDIRHDSPVRGHHLLPTLTGTGGVNYT